MENNYRHELKFLISRSAAELLRRRLPHFMRRDSHAGGEGQYTIRSLYFDDAQHSAYFDKMDGINERLKYRIRLYDYDASFLRLECKEKKGSLTRKTGQTVTKGDAAALQAGKTCPDTREGLAFQLMCSGLRPAVLVDYDRTPFVCNAGNTRITLDENLRTRPYNGDLFASNAAMIPVLDPDQVILEVKFDDFLPGYLTEILADIPKVNMAVSKFALCMNLI